MVLLRDRAFFLVLILFCSVAFSGFANAHPEENQNFKNQHIGVDFPVGWGDYKVNEVEFRVLYPAMEDGQGEAIAGNGPFPFTVFFGDDGEDRSDYMILAGEIVKRGTIVIVSNGFESDETTQLEESMSILEDIITFMNETNQSNVIIPAAFGNIDLNHWGVSGHGTGAAVAYSVFPFWQESSLSTVIQPPRSLFGLGTDFSEWPSGNGWESVRPLGWSIEPASPATGLFMTGTVDEIAKGQDNLPIITQTSELAWHWMHILGADHFQFQDDINNGWFGDDRGDGDASMSQQQQIEYALEHLLPYLDLTLRGVHDEFRPAFNREVSPTTSSDSESYTEEDLFQAEFLLIENQSKIPVAVNEFGRYDTFALLANWTLRNGDGFADISTDWQVDLECGFNQQVITSGSLHQNGTAQCDYEVEDLAPGQHTAFMTIMVEGAPSTIEHQFIRTDQPLSFVAPQPEIEVPERGTGYILASEIATDPDGQEVFIVEAVLSGGQINNFSIQLDSDYRGLSVTHTVTGEYITGAEVDVLMRADGGGVIDEADTTLEIVVVPFNDPVVKTEEVIMQTLIEDGPSIQVNITDFAYDPEGEPLLASINDQTEGSAGPVSFAYFQGVLTITPNPDANGATVLHVRVTDGATEAVDLDIPIQVSAVDDVMVVNNSMWNITMDEDETIALNISDFGFDIDGDELSWTIESNSVSTATAIISGSQIIISPVADYFGVINNDWLNVTDGTSVYGQLLNIEVISVPDLPELNLMDVNVIDDTAATLAYSVFDTDGFVDHPLEISLDGIVQQNLDPFCTYSGNSKNCATELEVPLGSNGTIEIRVAVADSAFTTDVVAYAEIDFNSSTPIVEEETETDDSSAVSSTIIVIGGLGLIIMVLVLVIILRAMKSEPVDTSQDFSYKQEDNTDVVEQELGVDLSATGLLSRINQNK